METKWKPEEITVLPMFFPSKSEKDVWQLLRGPHFGQTAPIPLFQYTDQWRHGLLGVGMITGDDMDHFPR